MRFLIPLLIAVGFICAPGPTVRADEALDWYLKGNELSRQGKFEEAVEAYYQAIMINPRATGPYYNLGLAYKHLKQYERAAAAFEGALRLEPGNVNIRLNLGNIYNLMERWGKAIGHLNFVVHRTEGIAEAHGNLGWAYLNYSEGPQFKLLVIKHLARAVELFEDQNMPEAAQATRQTLQEARKKFGYDQ